MDPRAIEDLLVEVAERLIRPRWRSLTEADVVEKNPGDLVTVADREAELAITEALLANDPRCLVVGEEAVFADPSVAQGLASAAHAWTVDPVDGTRNFVEGSPDYAVMLAELRHGVTVASWIWLPEQTRMLTARRGEGVWLDGLRLPALAEPQPPYRVAASRQRLRGWSSNEVAETAATWSCCGVDYLHLVTGDVDAVVYTHGKPWDHLPGALMLTELGGLVRRASGEDFDAAHTGDTLAAAASPRVWQAASAIWELQH